MSFVVEKFGARMGCFERKTGAKLRICVALESKGAKKIINVAAKEKETIDLGVIGIVFYFKIATT